MNIALLPSRALLAISGEDAASFLQGLISVDMRQLAGGKSLYGTLLSPQGKFLHDFFLMADKERILLDTDGARSAELKKRLALYKLRSKVAIADVPDMAVAAQWDGGAPVGDAIVIDDPRLPEMGRRLYGSAPPAASATEADYHRMRILLGVPDGAQDLIPEKSFLLEWGIDQLHGVDYQKGCYIGQEVTARTHYRGHVKKAPYIVKPEGGLLPAEPAPVYCGETEAGMLRSSCGDAGIALLRMEEVEKSRAAGMPLRVGDVVVSAQLPGWYRAKTEAGAA